MKKISFALVLGALCLLAACQSATSGSSAPTTSVYVGGCAYNGTADVAGYWKNGAWTALSDGTYDASVNSLKVSGTDVYAGGYADNGTVTIAGYWKNDTWTGFDAPYAGKEAVVNSIVVSGADVYAGGYAYNGTKDVAGYWKNGSWTALTDGTNRAEVYSLAVSGSDVYSAGYASDGTKAIAGYWKNTDWHPFENPKGSSYPAYAGSIVISGADVYIGADVYTDDIEEYDVAGYWKNGTWVDLPYTGETSWVSALAVSGNDVYASGQDIGTTGAAGYWKNGTWVALSVSDSIEPYVGALALSGTDVYAAGVASIAATGTAGMKATKRGGAKAASLSPLAASRKSVDVAGYWKNGAWTALANPAGALYRAGAGDIVVVTE